MKKLCQAALAWMTLGQASGLYYRGYTKAHHVTGDTQLSVTRALSWKVTCPP